MPALSTAAPQNSLSYAWWIVCFQLFMLVLGAVSLVKPAMRIGVTAMFAVLTTSTFLFTSNMYNAPNGIFSFSHDQAMKIVVPTADNIGAGPCAPPQRCRPFGPLSPLHPCSHDSAFADPSLPTRRRYSFYKGLALYFAGLIILDVRFFRPERTLPALRRASSSAN